MRQLLLDRALRSSKRELPSEVAEVLNVKALCEFFHCDPFRLGDLPDAWVEAAAMVLEAEGARAEREMKRIKSD